MDTSSQPQALVSRAVSLLSNNRVVEALEIAKQLLRSQPANIEALHIAAECSLRISEKSDAEYYLLRAIREKPDVVEAHSSLGLLLQQLKRYAEAVEAYQRALHLRPDLAEVHANLGLALEELDRISDAETSFRRAIALRPNISEMHNNLGRLLAKSRRYLEAEAAFKQALALQPDSADAYSNYGNLLLASHRFPEAEAAFRSALALRPDSAQTRSSYGILLRDLRRIPEAEAQFLYALSLRSDLSDTYTNYGILLYLSKRFSEADSLFQRAIAVGADSAATYNSYGNLLRQLKRYDEAEAAYNRALVVAPDLADARFNLGQLLLSVGRWSEGWPLYEARYDENITVRGAILPSVSFPQWRGEPLAGKSLLVWPEQGFGDEIQFVRYLPMLKAQGAQRITLVCKSELITLFQSVDGVDTVLTTDAEFLKQSTHDFWTFPLSIPLHVKTTLNSVPDKLPYLQPPKSRVKAWCPRLPADGVKVGLVWKGRDSHANDSDRSLPGLATLGPLWNVAGVTFISLQKGRGEEEALDAPVTQPITHLGSEIADFSDTAAIVAQLDLIISVDTAVAHLAGALGKPCWVLLPNFQADWRWMNERTDSPWYPGIMRIFRQKEGQDWSRVILEMAPLLGEFLATRTT